MMFILIVPVVIGLAALGPRFVRILRRKIRVKVNCWFCAVDSWVSYEHRNSWFCKKCEQYNGFNESGDYNADIPKQRFEDLNPQWFHPRVKQEAPPPDLTALPSPNGLCLNCNQNQTLKVHQLANFVPSSEANFDREVEEYKRRLEKAYSLCSKCEEFVRNQIRYQDAKFAPSVAKNTDSPTSRLNSQQRRNKKYVAVGRASWLLHVWSVLVVGVIWFSCLHALQDDSATQILAMESLIPVWMVELLPILHSQLFLLSLLLLTSHIGAMAFSKARLLFMDSVGVFCGSGLSLLSVGWLGSEQDALVWQTGLSSCSVMVFLWVAVLPRKRLRRSLPKIRGCVSLSVASTPVSQYTALDSPQRSWMAEEPTDMDVDVSRHSRESTPSRELGPKLNALSLGQPRAINPAKGPFWPVCFSGPGDEFLFKKRPLLTPSRLSNPTCSVVSANGWEELRGWCPSDGGSVASWLTSVSQREPLSVSTESAPSPGWSPLWKVALALVFLTSLITNALVLYQLLIKR